MDYGYLLEPLHPNLKEGRTSPPNTHEMIQLNKEKGTLQPKCSDKTHKHENIHLNNLKKKNNASDWGKLIFQINKDKK